MWAAQISRFAMPNAERRMYGSERHPGMCASKSRLKGSEVHVAECTPFVIESIVYPGNMCRDTSLCFFATPFT